ncbi:MAG: ATP-binding protein [Deltaproteobacteria bacterium]|nr:ATP-binding protein [Deltaproteobacteria bacterium]
MIPRRLDARLRSALGAFPVVALLGPRQVGKTTLALSLSEQLDRPCLYLDLERDSDLSKLEHAELYLSRHKDKLAIIDEVQRRPELFPLLRSLVDERIRSGERAGHFLVLGSASRELLRQSSESLAGRITYLELSPLSLDEIVAHEGASKLDRLWLRGGLPPSFLAETEELSWQWRTSFLSTYLERDIPQLGPRLPAERTRRLWTMLAYGQGDPLNAARLASSLAVSGTTVRHYVDVLTDLYMVRQLPAWSGNSTKRLVKSPKLYVRDSGLLHRLANIPDLETLLGHPLCGGSWEGLAVESILARMPDTWSASYYRTGAQAEIDLVLEPPGGQSIAIEIKRTLSPKVSRGFLSGCEDLGAKERYYAIPEGGPFPLGHDIEACGLVALLDQLVRRWP